MGMISGILFPLRSVVVRNWPVFVFLAGDGRSRRLLVLLPILSALLWPPRFAFNCLESLTVIKGGVVCSFALVCEEESVEFSAFLGGRVHELDGVVVFLGAPFEHFPEFGSACGEMGLDSVEVSMDVPDGGAVVRLARYVWDARRCMGWFIVHDLGDSPEFSWAEDALGRKGSASFLDVSDAP